MSSANKLKGRGRPPAFSVKDIEAIVFLYKNNEQLQNRWELEEICKKFGGSSQTFKRSLDKYYPEAPEVIDKIKQIVDL